MLIPPSAESPDDDPWRWLTPPWVTPLGPPSPSLWRFLKEHLPETVESLAQPDAIVPPWQEIYRQISPCTVLLQALLAPMGSPEECYDNLLKTALQEGFQDPSLLLGLLWHAPHGDALQRPERWDYLLDLVAAVLQEQSGRGAAFGLAENANHFLQNFFAEIISLQIATLEIADNIFGCATCALRETLLAAFGRNSTSRSFRIMLVPGICRSEDQRDSCEALSAAG